MSDGRPIISAHLHLLRSLRKGIGARLSYDEVFELMNDDAIRKRAEADECGDAGEWFSDRTEPGGRG